MKGVTKSSRKNGHSPRNDVINFIESTENSLKNCQSFKASAITHFTVVYLVAKPLIRNDAKGDLVMTQTLLLFKCKLLCYLAK